MDESRLRTFPATRTQSMCGTIVLEGNAERRAAFNNIANFFVHVAFFFFRVEKIMGVFFEEASGSFRFVSILSPKILIRPTPPCQPCDLPDLPCAGRQHAVTSQPSAPREAATRQSDLDTSVGVYTQQRFRMA